MTPTIPTRRPWLTAPRLAALVVLVSIGSGSWLLLAGAEAAVVDCVAGST